MHLPRSSFVPSPPPSSLIFPFPTPFYASSFRSLILSSLSLLPFFTLLNITAPPCPFSQPFPFRSLPSFCCFPPSPSLALPPLCLLLWSPYISTRPSSCGHESAGCFCSGPGFAETSETALHFPSLGFFFPNLKT